MQFVGGLRSEASAPSCRTSNLINGRVTQLLQLV
jgi:hypothetical protein